MSWMATRTNSAETLTVTHRVNEDVAGHLEEAARLLRDQGADPYRVNAYRRAAMTLRASTQAVGALYREQDLEA